MTMLKTTLLLGLFSVIWSLNEDTIVVDYNNAARLSGEGNYEQAWEIYANLLKEPELPDTMLCQITGFMGKYAGSGVLEKSESIKILEEAIVISKDLISREPACINARVHNITAIGILSDLEWNPKRKYKHALNVRNEAKKIINLAPEDARGYYIMGKWAQILTGISGISRFIVDNFFDGIPEEASFSSAESYYKIAIRKDPEYILYHYAIASLYEQTGNRDAASRHLIIAASLPIREKEDYIRREQCTALYNQIKTK